MATKPFEIQVYINGKHFPDPFVAVSGLGEEIKAHKTHVNVVFKRELRKFLNQIASDMEKQHSGPYPGGTGADSLSKRSGRGVKSVKQSVYVKGNSLSNTEGGIGGISYLRTHEFGADIHPKRAKYLTVPLSAALNANGTPRKMSARQWDNTFVNRSKNGNLLIFRKDSRGRITPLYLLVGPGEKRRSIDLRDKKRLGMGRAIQKRMDDFADTLSTEILKLVGGPDGRRI